jgi:hypothetical protein
MLLESFVCVHVFRFSELKNEIAGCFLQLQVILQDRTREAYVRSGRLIQLDRMSKLRCSFHV